MVYALVNVSVWLSDLFTLKLHIEPCFFSLFLFHKLGHVCIMDALVTAENVYEHAFLDGNASTAASADDSPTVPPSFQALTNDQFITSGSTIVIILGTSPAAAYLRGCPRPKLVDAVCSQLMDEYKGGIRKVRWEARQTRLCVSLNTCTPECLAVFEEAFRKYGHVKTLSPEAHSARGSQDATFAASKAKQAGAILGASTAAELIKDLKSIRPPGGKQKKARKFVDQAMEVLNTGQQWAAAADLSLQQQKLEDESD